MLEPTAEVTGALETRQAAYLLDRELVLAFSGDKLVRLCEPSGPEGVGERHFVFAEQVEDLPARNAAVPRQHSCREAGVEEQALKLRPHPFPRVRSHPAVGFRDD